MTSNDQEFGPDADEDLPEEVVDAIENGVPALSAVRQWHGWSTDELSQRSGVSAAAVLMAEYGHTLESADRRALARTLGVGEDLLID